MAGRSRHFLLAIALLLTVNMFSGGVRAQTGALSDEELLQVLVSGRPLEADWFATELLAQVPLSHIQRVVDGIRGDTGAAPQVSGDSERYYLRTARHRVPVTLRRRADGRIIGLFFHPAIATEAGLAEVFAGLRGLPGQISYLVLRDDGEVGSYHADAALAVGSAFKLAVLATLKQEIEAGRARWDEVVQLEEAHRSLPTGTMHKLPVHAPLTLHTLAAAMISQSDNTATDVLIDRLGRDAVATAAGTELLLTTREYFQLKADPALYRRYSSAGLAGRRALLRDMADRPLPRTHLVLRPLQRGAEWHMSVRRLCALMAEVLDLDVMRIEPGPVDPQPWIRVGYKGGSEIGVMNLTSGLIDRDGHRYCVSVTWNDGVSVDRNRLVEQYLTLLSALRQK